MNISETIGKWPGILRALGVGEQFLQNKHGPCPLCGGKDRYRFTDHEGRGMWICNQCGAGDGIALLMKMFGWDFKSALKEIEKIMGIAETTPIKSPIDFEKHRKMLKQMWVDSAPTEAGDIAGKYLRSRGIEVFPKGLRTLEKCRTSRGEYHPAMLGVVMDANGKAAAFHRTYLSDSGKAKIESPREMTAGKLPENIAIRLGDVGKILGIAEGIETALSASMIFNIPVWSAINATMMMKWHPPKEVEEVWVCGDSDKSFTGQCAAYTLANRLTIKGLRCKVMLPMTLGEDWNDVLNYTSTK